MGVGVWEVVKWSMGVGVGGGELVWVWEEVSWCMGVGVW